MLPIVLLWQLIGTLRSIAFAASEAIAHEYAAALQQSHQQNLP
jgi:uncharacterized protein YejL (UPF0352 family)